MRLIQANEYASIDLRFKKSAYVPIGHCRLRLVDVVSVPIGV